MSETHPTEKTVSETESCCCCSDDGSTSVAYGPYVTGTISTPVGDIPCLSGRWSARDWLGTVRVRLGCKRMDYGVRPGLYAIGTPDAESPVFVTANYKKSFDHLRRDLDGHDGWIMVLDTEGINVWCAAGEGTFGTDEILRQIESTKLHEVVSHRQLILPQLGAPGVSAHRVREESGFQVEYGPIRSRDLPEYLSNDQETTEQMRRVRFNLWDRLVLVPVEIISGLKYAVIVTLVLALLGGIGSDGYSLTSVWASFPLALAVCGVGLLAGGGLTPLLLPYLPGRAFSLKGGIMGGLTGGAVMWAYLKADGSVLAAVAGLCLIVAFASARALNFTGASTYTSLSGVQREMRVAVPLQCFLVLSGIVLWAIA